MPAKLSPHSWGDPLPKRETRSARFEMLIRPSLKARAEAVAVSQGQTLSDYVHDTVEAAVKRAEAKRQG